MVAVAAIIVLAFAVSGRASSSLIEVNHRRHSYLLGERFGIKSDSMISYEGVYFGYAPNWSPRVTMAELNEATGQRGAMYNVYSQITLENVDSESYDGNYQYPVDDIISSGAVLIASLMPKVDWEDITPQLSRVSLVWLRYAHEMNYYADPNVEVYPGERDYDAFKQSWKTLYDATRPNNQIYMFWSPNKDTDTEPAAPWWPGSEYVDIVGMDYYPEADDLPDFGTAYGQFYDTYAKGYGLPFAVAEAGTQLNGSAASTEKKEQWLKNVINPAKGFGEYAQWYFSCTWFEYGPPANEIDFYVVYNQTAEVIEKTISNTENGA